MRIDRRLVLIGVMLVVLSMTMATQYATTKIGYTYNLVHPSNADIRFIGSDNSTDNIRVLRVDGDNSSNQQALKIRLGGNLSANQNMTYSAAFGIVNEEIFNVTITHINVSTLGGTDPDYMQVWLHGDRDALCENDASSVMVWDKGDLGYNSTSTVWNLSAGDQDASTIDGGSLTTPWDSTANVRYSTTDTNAVNETDDYVWVQISLDLPSNADSSLTYEGMVYVHTRASTTDN